MSAIPQKRTFPEHPGHHVGLVPNPDLPWLGPNPFNPG